MDIINAGFYQHKIDCFGFPFLVHSIHTDEIVHNKDTMPNNDNFFELLTC